MKNLPNLRQEYGQPPLEISAVDDCPFKQFESWFVEATNRLREPNAMVLATVDSEGAPAQRSVLLKYFDEQGLVFFTNYNSRKAAQISENKNVALLFPWYACQRQVEMNGVIEKTTSAESISYFALRPRGSQLGAWVSHQSAVVSARGLLENRLHEMKVKFANGEVPKPPAWGGFRMVPSRFEFWQGGRDRLHDRIEYTRQSDSAWKICRLAP